MRDPLQWLSVRHKLALMYVGLGLIAYGLGGFLISESAKSALEQEILRRLEFQCQSYAGALDSQLQLLTRRAEDFASDGYIRGHLASILNAPQEVDLQARRTELWQHLAENKLPIERAFSNVVITKSDLDEIVSVTPLEDQELKPLRVSEATVVRTSYSGLIQAVDANESPQLLIATPLMDIRGQQQIGYLVACVRVGVWVARALLSSNDGLRKNVEDVQLHLYDHRGMRLKVPPGFGSASSPQEESEVVIGGVGMQLERAAGRPGGNASYSPTRGTITQRYPISTNEWTVEVGLRADRAWMPVSGLQSRFLALGLLLAMVSIVLLYFPMRFLAKPLVELTRAAQRVREGDFSTRVEIDSGDEIGDLAISFNHMAAAVEERTSKLETSATELRRQQAITKKERDRLDAVIASMKDGLVVLDANGGVVIANSAASSLLAIMRARGSEVRGHHRCDDPAAKQHQNCLRCLLDPTGVGRSCLVDVGDRSLEIHVTLLPPGMDGTSGRVLVARDVTDRITQDEQQIHQERLAVLGEVAAVMAHELNNPLASITMFNQLLEANLPADSPLRENVDVISRNTDTCKQTIRGLLDYATGATPETVLIDVHETLREVAQFLDPISQRSGVSITTCLEARNPVVRGDEIQLRQVFVNLIMNAIQAIQAVGEVRLTTTEENGHLFIDVHDTGSGIGSDRREQVFRPFYTSKRRGQGTGLGLSTARRIAEMHGGSLDLIETSSAGTQFRVRLRVHGGELQV